MVGDVKDAEGRHSLRYLFRSSHRGLSRTTDDDGHRARCGRKKSVARKKKNDTWSHTKKQVNMTGAVTRNSCVGVSKRTALYQVGRITETRCCETKYSSITLAYIEGNTCLLKWPLNGSRGWQRNTNTLTGCMCGKIIPGRIITTLEKVDKPLLFAQSRTALTFSSHPVLPATERHKKWSKGKIRKGRELPDRLRQSRKKREQLL